MISPVTLNQPPVIEFGSGKITVLPDYLQDCGRIFILADEPIASRMEPLASALKSAGKAIEFSTDVVPEPPFEALERLLEPVRAFSPDAVVGVGGGSAMDLAKLVSVLFDGIQKAEDIIGIGNVKGRKVKLITASTTAGTGSAHCCRSGSPI